MIRYDHYTDKFVKVSDRECPWCKAVCASTDKYCHECGWHIADTPQTEQMKTADYCDICKQDMCKDCIADATNPYCVPSHYEINYEPKDEPTTQTETQNSNLTFEKRTMLDCYNCKRYKNDDACVECRYEPTADTPQTDAEIPKNALRSDCTGCRFVGAYDTEFPCENCVRKNKDYYSAEEFRRRGR